MSTFTQHRRMHCLQADGALEQSHELLYEPPEKLRVLIVSNKR